MHHLVVHITIAYQDWLGSVTVGRQPPRPAGLTRWKCPMPGPAPTCQPTFTPEQVADCERLVRQHRAPQLQVARAKLALLLHDDPCAGYKPDPWPDPGTGYPRVLEIVRG